MVPDCKIDHLVVGALTLAEGVEYIRETMGVEIPAGGAHSALATHNHLMAIGEDVFLEVIAPDEAACESPDRFSQPRWYGLDDPYVRASLHQSPALIAWVVNTQAIQAMAQVCSWPLGNIVTVKRGKLSWNFALPYDGALPAGGMLPYAIEWATSAHPARNMTDCGIRLEQLEISHPEPDWLTGHLASVNAKDLVTLRETTSTSAPALTATFLNVASGNRMTLNSPIPR